LPMARTPYAVDPEPRSASSVAGGFVEQSLVFEDRLEAHPVRRRRQGSGPRRRSATRTATR